MPCRGKELCVCKVGGDVPSSECLLELLCHTGVMNSVEIDFISNILETSSATWSCDVCIHD